MENIVSQTQMVTDNVHRPKFSIDEINYQYTSVEENFLGKVFGQDIAISKNFSNFVVGQSNREAVQIAMQIAHSPGNKGLHSTVFLHSSPGLGKTHLLYAMANEILVRHPKMNIALLSGRSFNKELVDAIQNQNPHQFYERYSNVVDILLIDDIHEFKGKPELQKMVFDIFKTLNSKGKQIVFTADDSPSKIFGGSDSFLSQLSWSRVVGLKKPDYETRLKILQNKRAELKLNISQRIEHLIAINSSENIRQIEGSLLKLSAYSELMGQQEISLDQAIRFLGLEESKSTEEHSFETIASGVASFYKIPVAQIMSKDRARQTQLARSVLIYLAKTLLKCTFKEIGEKLGGRHHSTIIDSFEKVNQAISSDTKFSKDIFEIESLINN